MSPFRHNCVPPYFVFCGASRDLPLCFSVFGGGRVSVAALVTTGTFGGVLAAGVFLPWPLLCRFGWLLGGRGRG